VQSTIAALALLAALAPGPAAALDWTTAADERTVHVLTRDDDGDPRETKVWLVVVDGRAYVRTGNTTWGDNVVRDPRVRLRVGDRDLPVVATLIEDEDTRARVIATFRDRYGWTDALLSPLRGRRPKIIRLDAEPDAAAGGPAAAPGYSK
jgi:hypothetical protein